MKRKKSMGLLLVTVAACLLSGCDVTHVKEVITKQQEETQKVTETISENETEKSSEKLTETESITEEKKETETTEAVTEAVEWKWTVMIDAGHQGSWVDMSAQEPMAPGSDQTKAKATTGTSGQFSGVPEYEVNLQVSKVLQTELEHRGYRVVMVREDHDTAISNKERAELATAENADISVRIHANGSDDSSVAGALTMAPSTSNPYLEDTVIQQSNLLSEYVLQSYCSSTGLANLGVLATDTMTGINWSTVPVTIVEMGFMSNQGDDLYITDQNNHQKMAEGIADGIDAYFADVQPPKKAIEKEKATDKEAGKDTDQAANKNAGSEEAEQNMTLLTELLEENYMHALWNAGEKWSVAVRNLKTNEVCMIQADQQLQSASVIKVFIMAAVYERAVFAAESGKEMIDMAESYDGELRSLIENMITVSDNEAANELVRRLGQGDFEAGAAVVNEFCQEHGYEATHMGRMFLAENPTDDNYTSAADCCKILTEIYRGELISPDASGRMKEILLSQTRTGKIPAGIPQDVVTGNKTGEMPAGYGLGTIENDIALVLYENNPYVLCVLSNEIADNAAAQQTITEISAEVYQYLK